MVVFLNVLKLGQIKDKILVMKCYQKLCYNLKGASTAMRQLTVFQMTTKIAKTTMSNHHQTSNDG